MVTPLHLYPEQASPPVLLLLDANWRAKAEMHLVSFNSSRLLNGAGEGDATVHLHAHEEHEGVEGLLAPWSTVVLVSSELTHGAPTVLWGGYIVKPSRVVGEPQVRLALREWPDWLNRIWTSGPAAEYPTPNVPPPTDGGEVIRHRMEAAVGMCRTGELHPPLVQLPAPAPVGLEVDVDFPDQNDVDSPKTIAGEIGEIVALGVEWWMEWERTDAGEFLPRLHTSTYNPLAPATIGILAGSDTASMTIERDTATQATKTRVIGAYGLDATREASPSPASPPLWEVRSYEQLGARDPDDATALPKVQALADAINSRHSKPLLLTPDLPLVGLREEFKPGQIVEVCVERDFDPILTATTRFVARVMEIRYLLDGNKSETALTLASVVGEGITPVSIEGQDAAAPKVTADPIAPPQVLPPHDPVEYMRELGRRISALESKQETKSRP